MQRNLNEDWSKLQQELRQYPPPMLFGTSRQVDGYYNLELLERGVAFESLREHRTETALWYQALRLLSEPLNGEWVLPEDPVLRKAEGLQLEILALEISSAKAAIDLMLGGHYSIALASIRHMIEGFVQIFWLQCYPDKADLWYGETPDPPKCRTMIDQIQKYIRGVEGKGTDTSAVEKIYDAWKLMCNGSHPTGGGITQVQPTIDDPRHIVGPVYRPELAYVAFDNGLYALTKITSCISHLRVSNEDWELEFEDLERRIGTWRESLRDKELLRDYMTSDNSLGTDSDLES